jgi:hypothetical protein
MLAGQRQQAAQIDDALSIHVQRCNCRPAGWRQANDERIVVIPDKMLVPVVTLG